MPRRRSQSRLLFPWHGFPANLLERSGYNLPTRTINSQAYPQDLWISALGAARRSRPCCLFSVPLGRQFPRNSRALRCGARGYQGHRGRFFIPLDGNSGAAGGCSQVSATKGATNRWSKEGRTSPVGMSLGCWSNQGRRQDVFRVWVSRGIHPPSAGSAPPALGSTAAGLQAGPRDVS